jgi:hypothetical protein
MSLAPRPPLYARVLRLRRIRPSGLLCFLFFEGMIALGVLLALAELVSWWAVPVLPVVVAGMVKLNDLITAGAPGSAALPESAGPESAGEEPALPDPGAGPYGQLAQGAQVGPPPPDPEPEDPVAVPGPRDARQVSRDPAATLDPADSPRQRFRQSAHRRYQ